MGHGFIGGGDGDGAAAGHRIARVDHQVDDGVGKLRLVGVDGPQVGVALHFQRDALAHQAAQHLRQLADHLAQGKLLGLHGLLAAEGQKLAHQIGRAQRILMHLVKLLERGIARRVTHQQEFAIADDNGEQIVEIMRHPPGKLTHRLQLLGLGELGFQRLLFGNIEQIEHGIAGHVALHGRGEQLGHAVFAGRRLAAAQFDGGKAGFARRGTPDQRQHLGTVARIHQIGEVGRNQRTACAEEVGQRGIGVQKHAGGIDKAHTHGRIAKQLTGIFKGLNRGRRFGRGRGFGDFRRRLCRGGAGQHRLGLI